MVANQRYVPHAPRSVGLGGALTISGLMIAGLLTFVPDAVRIATRGPIQIIDIKQPVPPPPEPKPQPKTEPQASDPKIYIPQPPIPQPQQPVLEGTDVLPVEPPQPGIAENPGPAGIAEAPKPLPPLIGAEQDPRYARDFQPDYPAQELRAERDGKVLVRVLIGTDGRVKAVEQVSATSAAFFEATRRQALAKWRFKPATRGGVPQESWKTMNVRFELKNA